MSRVGSILYWVSQDNSFEFSHKMLCAILSHSVMSTSLWPPWTIAHQAPLSLAFSRQEYWNGLLFPSSGDPPNPGVKLRSLTLQADSLPFEPTGKPIFFQDQTEIRKTQSFYSWSPLKNPHSVCWELKLKRKKKSQVLAQSSTQKMNKFGSTHLAIGRNIPNWVSPWTLTSVNLSFWGLHTQL